MANYPKPRKTPARVTARHIEEIKDRILANCDHCPDRYTMNRLLDLDDAIYDLGYRPERRTLRKRPRRRPAPRTTVLQDVVAAARDFFRGLCG